jgi:hypothetical protein
LRIDLKDLCSSWISVVLGDQALRISFNLKDSDTAMAGLTDLARLQGCDLALQDFGLVIEQNRQVLGPGDSQEIQTHLLVQNDLFKLCSHLGVDIKADQAYLRLLQAFEMFDQLRGVLVDGSLVLFLELSNVSKTRLDSTTSSGSTAHVLGVVLDMLRLLVGAPAPQMNWICDQPNFVAFLSQLVALQAEVGNLLQHITDLLRDMGLATYAAHFE